MKEKKFSVRVLAEIAIFAAIAFALDALQGGIFRGVFAAGGSIGIAMVPIFVIAYRRGFLAGFLCGLVVSLIQMLGGIYVIQGASFENEFMQVMGPFLQVMLDYVLAYTFVGLIAGIFGELYLKEQNDKRKLVWIIVGTILAGLFKYACHVIAGGVFWLGDGSSGFWGVANDSWLYSFVYNGAYSIPNIVLCTPIMVLIAKFYPKFLNINYVEKEEIEEDKKIIDEGETKHEEL